MSFSTKKATLVCGCSKDKHVIVNHSVLFLSFDKATKVFSPNFVQINILDHKQNLKKIRDAEMKFPMGECQDQQYLFSTASEMWLHCKQCLRRKSGITNFSSCFSFQSANQ